MLEFYNNFQVKRSSSSYVLIGSANGLSPKPISWKIFFFLRQRISNVRALNSRVRKFHDEIIFVADLFVGVGSLFFCRFPRYDQYAALFHLKKQTV